METAQTGYRLGPGEGEQIWFLGTLMTVKAGAQQGAGSFTLIEQLAPPGFGPGLHVHRHEDEAFYLLEGAITVTCGEQTWEAPAGSFVFLPRGIPHRFEVTAGGPARLLQLTSPAGFEAFAAEIGEPATSPTLPPPGAPDVPRLLAAMARHGYDSVPPAPSPVAE